MNACRSSRLFVVHYIALVAVVAAASGVADSEKEVFTVALLFFSDLLSARISDHSVTVSSKFFTAFKNCILFKPSYLF